MIPLYEEKTSDTLNYIDLKRKKNIKYYIALQIGEKKDKYVYSSFEYHISKDKPHTYEQEITYLIINDYIIPYTKTQMHEANKINEFQSITLEPHDINTIPKNSLFVLLQIGTLVNRKIKNVYYACTYNNPLKLHILILEKIKLMIEELNNYITWEKNNNNSLWSPNKFIFITTKMVLEHNFTRIPNYQYFISMQIGKKQQNGEVEQFVVTLYAKDKIELDTNIEKLERLIVRYLMKIEVIEITKKVFTYQIISTTINKLNATTEYKIYTSINMGTVINNTMRYTRKTYIYEEAELIPKHTIKIISAIFNEMEEYFKKNN